MSEIARLVLTIEEGFQGLEFKPIKVLRIYVPRHGDWPRKSERPVISLMAEDDLGLSEQLALWIKAGRLPAAELRSTA